MCERLDERAAVVIAQPLPKFLAGELARRLGHGALAVRPAGLEARWRGRDGWRPLERFEPPAGEAAGLRRWRGSVAIGEPEAVETLCRANP